MEIAAVLLILLFFLALCFFFSGIETGLISLNRLKLENEARSDRKSERLLRFIQHPDKVLGTTLIGYNIVNVILASLATYFVTRCTQNSAFHFDPRWTTLIVASIVLIFGEIIPKAIFRDYADTLVPRLFPVLRFFYTILKPFIWAVSWLNRMLHKLLHLDSAHPMLYLTRDDLAFILTQNTADIVSEPQREMIEDALEFNELVARNVMVPRKDIVAVEASTPMPEVLELARRETFTRYPVYRETLDNIVGVLIIYDLIRRKEALQLKAGELMHEPLFAPENMDLDILLREMQKAHKSMAIIVDSFGGTAGLVTMEDILEEIVGEIEDEYDIEEEEEKDVEQLAPDSWLAQGEVELSRLIDDWGMDLPEGDYETLAGLMIDRLERIPRRNQSLQVGDYRLTVAQATNRKINKVKIQYTPPPDANQEKDDKEVNP